MEKNDLKNKIIEYLEIELNAATKSLEQSRELMNQDDLKPEGKYDTRRTEVGYLVSAQGKRVEEIKSDFVYIQNLEIRSSVKVEVGSIMTLLHNGKKQDYFISPTYSGMNLKDIKLTILSFNSPLAQAAMTLEEEDFFEIESPKGDLEYKILKIK